jgi:hypothetical protein
MDSSSENSADEEKHLLQRGRENREIEEDSMQSLFSYLCGVVGCMDSCCEKRGVRGVLAVQNPEFSVTSVTSVPALKNLAFMASWRFNILNPLCLL